MIQTTYDSKRPLVGFGGHNHPSKAEARISFYLAKFGILKDDSLLPLTFYDCDGTPFRAKADFRHAATGIRFEFKQKSVNGVGSKATSKRQLANSRSKSENKKAIEFGWNHSAEKIGITQFGIAGAGQGVLVLIFEEMPDAKVMDRLNKRGIFWLVLHTRAWQQFAVLYLKLARFGCAASLVYRHPETGDPLHVFHPGPQGLPQHLPVGKIGLPTS